MHDAALAGKSLIASCNLFSHDGENFRAEAIMQMDITFTPKHGNICVYPQIEYLNLLHKEAPNATFILTFRPIEDWIQSIAQWKGDLRTRLADCDLPGFPKGVGTTDEELKAFFCDQVTRIRNFVAANPSHALVELDLYDTTTNARTMAQLFRANESCWGHSNVGKFQHDETRLL
jgi:hypothetical protein